MEIKNRLFPYPVLCGDTDDYSETTEFIIVPTIEDRIHDISLKYSFEIKCDSLETLLRQGKAEYMLHIECSTTAFRKVIRNGIPNIEFNLPKSKVSGEVTLVAMLVAVVDIDGYTSNDLNEDYSEEFVSFKKGSILAYQNLPSIFVTKKTDDLANNESFFTVIKITGTDPEEIRPLSFNLNNDKIQILVDQKTYEAFVKFKHIKSVAMAMLVLPALAFMIEEAGENPDHYSGYRWFHQMEAFYKAKGKDFVADVLQRDENSVIVAQEMLQNPVSSAYRELFELEN